jgi:ABC-type Fe3+-hydroxamate transport system substrate-binding protein
MKTMNKRNMFVILPVMLALALTGCGEKEVEDAPSPSTSSTLETSPAPVTPESVETLVPAEETPAAGGLENTDAAELEKTVKSYNKEVDASNDKAKDIIEAYNGQIKSATGK